MRRLRSLVSDIGKKSGFIALFDILFIKCSCPPILYERSMYIIDTVYP